MLTVYGIDSNRRSQRKFYKLFYNYKHSKLLPEEIICHPVNFHNRFYCYGEVHFYNKWCTVRNKRQQILFCVTYMYRKHHGSRCVCLIERWEHLRSTEKHRCCCSNGEVVVANVRMERWGGSCGRGGCDLLLFV